MKSKFHITGLFYELKGYKFRKFLNIKLMNTAKLSPDLMVVMMNPGASRPLDGIDNNTVESEAIPDRTQNQIMKVMTACKLEYARVLNLSDIRETKSNLLFPKLLKMDSIGIPHSIFDDRRKDDFDSLFIKDVPVLFAWGVGKDLKGLAEKAIESINIDNPIGMKKEGLEWAFYHPLPQNYGKQKEWVDEIIHQIKSTLDKLNERPKSDNLKVVKDPIKDHISNSPKFNSYSQEQGDLFDEWKTKSIQTLKAIGINCNPKEIIYNLSESLLKRSQAIGLKDSNDIHQHLMNYWNETMQYDCKIIASDGWSSKPNVILPSIKDFDNLNKCFKFTNDLVPKELVINRYLKKEKEQLEAARLIKANSQMDLTRFKEEHSGPNGYLTVVGKLNKVNIKTRIKKLQSKTNVVNELKVLNQCLDLLDRKNILNKAFKLIEKIIDSQAIMRYPILSEEEFKTLVVEDKWMCSIERSIKGVQTEQVSI